MALVALLLIGCGLFYVVDGVRSLRRATIDTPFRIGRGLRTYRRAGEPVRWGCTTMVHLAFGASLTILGALVARSTTGATALVVSAALSAFGAWLAGGAATHPLPGEMPPPPPPDASDYRQAPRVEAPSRRALRLAELVRIGPGACVSLTALCAAAGVVALPRDIDDTVPVLGLVAEAVAFVAIVVTLRRWALVVRATRERAEVRPFGIGAQAGLHQIASLTAFVASVVVFHEWLPIAFVAFPIFVGQTVAGPIVFALEKSQRTGARPGFARVLLRYELLPLLVALIAIAFIAYLLASPWSAHAWDAMNWRTFRAVCARLFAAWVVCVALPQAALASASFGRT
jgi:hypothetical protein